LKVKANDDIKVLSLERNPKIKVVGLIKEALLSVQHIRISEILYAVEDTKTILILGTNWFDRY